MRVRFRPTVAADLPHVIDKPLPYRIKAITALIGDQVVGVGGVTFRPDGTVVAFAHMGPELKRHPAAVQRAGRLGMALIRSAGIAHVVAEAEPGNPAAERWLRHFGFQPVEACGGRAFVWRRET